MGVTRRIPKFEDGAGAGKQKLRLLSPLGTFRKKKSPSGREVKKRIRQGAKMFLPTGQLVSQPASAPPSFITVCTGMPAGNGVRRWGHACRRFAT